MQFSEVIGQESVKRRLICQFSSGHHPHALLLNGPEGCGKFPMALALANYLLCEHSDGIDTCGHCAACRMVQKLEHPDLYFSFPFLRKSETTISDNYLKEWKNFVRDGAYFGYIDWLNNLSDDNKQLLITDAEGDNIINKMSMTSYMGGYKVMIIWHAEKMHPSAANNLLKILEEPPLKTVFILLTDNPSQILPTIYSRTQEITMKALSIEDIADALQRRGLSQKDAIQIARISAGSYVNALRHISMNSDAEKKLNKFKDLMRKAYARDMTGLQGWAEEIASWKREIQKDFLAYCQKLIRENFIYNFHQPSLNYMSDPENEFATKFARFINNRNVVELMTEITQAQKDIEHNVNGKILFFDLALKIIVLIRK